MSEPLAQGCATFITEGPNAIKQIRPRAAPSFHTGCLVLVTGIKIHFVVLRLARGPQVAHPCASVSLHNNRIVKLALVQCECHTGKQSVIARIKSNRNQDADFRFSKNFWFIVPISRGTNARFAPCRRSRK